MDKKTYKLTYVYIDIRKVTWTNTQTHGPTDKNMDQHTDTDTDKPSDRHMDHQKYTWTNIQTDKPSDRHIDQYKGTWTNIQTPKYRHMDQHINALTNI